MRIISFLTLLVALAFSDSCRGGGGQQSEDDGPPSGYRMTAPLFDNLGSHHFPISTDVPLAQRYFNQGLILSYGFNHVEAARSFRESQKLDPQCAMAYWGEALVMGLNINAGMEDANVGLAWDTLQKAVHWGERATPRERAYVAALASRYSPQVLSQRAPLDLAYAQAMRELAQEYPDDMDAQTLFAEAFMDTTPWDYWLEGERPKPVTIEILSMLERVLAIAPNHPGANHFYIHAAEAEHPQRPEASADRLGALVPGAGHLVHMPSHVYVRLGRYSDASRANEMATTADRDYVTQCHAQGMYPLAYVPHNHHFLWFSTSMEGRGESSIQAARHVSEHVDAGKMREPGCGTLQHFHALPLYALTRFGKWDEILQYPPPAEDLKYPIGVWHYARGMALTRKGRLEEAKQRLGHLEGLAADPELEQVTIWDINTTRSILQIASECLAAEIAAQDGRLEEAVERFGKAARMEDALRYDEPPPWYFPVRQALGAVLLRAGRPAEAESMYRHDLGKYPANGWSLFGLSRALAEQQKQRQARQVYSQYERAWRRADAPLKDSRY